MSQRIYKDLLEKDLDLARRNDWNFLINSGDQEAKKTLELLTLERTTNFEYKYLDNLTKIGNRLLAQERVRSIVDDMRDHDNIGATGIMIDLDAFKPVNDSWGGHQVGNQFLKHVATTITQYADYAFRLSGDEFFLINKYDDSEFDYKEYGKKVALDVNTSLFEHQGILQVQASLGVVDFKSLEWLMQVAHDRYELSNIESIFRGYYTPMLRDYNKDRKEEVYIKNGMSPDSNIPIKTTDIADDRSDRMEFDFYGEFAKRANVIHGKPYSDYDLYVLFRSLGDAKLPNLKFTPEYFEANIGSLATSVLFGHADDLSGKVKIIDSKKAGVTFSDGETYLVRNDELVKAQQNWRYAA